MTRIYQALSGLGLLIVAALALFFGGRAAATREIEQRQAIRRAEAFEQRGQIEDEIANDTSLLDRARRNGVVRRPRD